MLEFFRSWMYVVTLEKMQPINTEKHFFYFFELNYTVSLAYFKVMKTTSPDELTFRHRQTSAEDYQRPLLNTLCGHRLSPNCDLSSPTAIKLIMLIARELAMEKYVDQ